MEVLKYSRVNKNGRLVEFTYSECDQELIESKTWYVDRGYIVTSERCNNSVIKYRLHNMIMNPENGVIDHVDGDTLNNTRDNLREVTVQQNNINRRGWKKGTKSGHKGVYFEGGKFRARLQIHGKKVHLGLYDDLEDAIAARKAGEEKYFGEFNRPEIREFVGETLFGEEK